ncbi:Hypothetical predicted protein [Pelobates cultripes]|uniref:Uncharacterized protein n=1 Tax=Pelobates cultripes TaxID=61616 RepID=A0AAD1W4E6_PELCU|nr:Hypothetical predicted protein [Pelobates cultripes]
MSQTTKLSQLALNTLTSLEPNGKEGKADLLKPLPKLKIAPQPDPHDSTSEEELLDAHDDIPPQEGEDLTAPGTKGDIKALMNNSRAFFNADLNIIREDMTGVTAGVQTNEDNISFIAQKQRDTNELIQQLQAAHKALQVRLDTLDDARRHNNLKIRGIAESVTKHKLPHFLKHLLATLLPQFTDLWCSILKWRWSFQPITKTLCSANINYKWGPSRELMVSRDGRTHQLSTAEESIIFLQGLNIILLSHGMARSGRRWDVHKIVPFTPRAAADTI